MSGDKKRQEIREQLSKEISDNLSGLEQDVSRLKAERDLTLAEMEELSASRGYWLSFLFPFCCRID